MDKKRAMTQWLLASIVTTTIMSMSLAHADPSVSSSSTVEPLRVARYSTLAPMVTTEQQNPLAVIISLHFPQQIHNVSEAIDVLLQRSGYRVDKTISEPAWVVLDDLPLPAVHRDLGPITLDQALRTLAGNEFAMRVNHLKRKVAFFARRGQQEPSPFEDLPSDRPTTVGMVSVR